MSNHEKLYTPVQGKTYSLFAEGDDSEQYYPEIKRLTDVLLQRYPDEKRFLSLIQKVGERLFLLGLKTTGADRKTLQFVRETLRQSLSIYTQNVSNHLKTLPLAKRMDSTLATTEEKYHLYMLEIALVNRIHFRSAPVVFKPKRKGLCPTFCIRSKSLFSSGQRWRKTSAKRFISV